MFEYSKVDFGGKWWAMYTPSNWKSEPIIGKKDSAEALAKPPMFKDVMEQVEETPYWKDDYSKPFEFIELYSRCHILLHRKRPIRSVAK